MSSDHHSLAHMTGYSVIRYSMFLGRQRPMFEKISIAIQLFLVNIRIAIKYTLLIYTYTLYTYIPSYNNTPICTYNTEERSEAPHIIRKCN